ncbi:MBL fold metallo-hydrolase RNA specificity domain-containing protein [Eubacterium xylanophilum]|uniref:MBL fold metallo-hydrolase RNA specificity domain-containing protein n=1 Tax=Eubacterium xylanophilum TaxID=39497 RepID=UPI00047B0E9A|nr:MBL fold metallo-hydrolase [Eubacterium xylanophilum]
MKLEFLGAAHEVTGSCHYLEIGDKRLCVDIGMQQGRNLFESQEIPVNAAELDYILLTHAHIDHTGLLPMLYARGFRGQVFATKATADLCDIMLRDSAHIQQFEAEWRNRKAQRSGGEPYVPLYTMEDAIGAIRLLVPCEYDSTIHICDGIEIRFTDVGHLLGSSSIEIFATEDGETRVLCFSGDLGNRSKPILRDPVYTRSADYVIMESTYGDRLHGEKPDYVGELADIIERTFERGGNVVIPAFAVGRTQELLYFIRQIKERELIRSYPDFEVYVDSPLAVEATTIFGKNVERCFDEEAKELVNKGINPIGFKGLCLSITSDDSKGINMNNNPKVIISASGMCEAGRIRHHLKHNLWRSDSTVVFVGYQSVGTLGRSLLDGATSVKLFGEEIDIQAEIVKISGISGHADKNGLLDWIDGFTEQKPKKVFVVHGEDKVTEAFAECVKKEHGIEAVAPYSGTVFDLITGEFEHIAEPVYAKKKEISKKRAMDVFGRLVMAGERLAAVIRKNEGLSNKDTAKFTDQINSLCDKWDR